MALYTEKHELFGGKHDIARIGEFAGYDGPNVFSQGYPHPVTASELYASPQSAASKFYNAIGEALMQPFRLGRCGLRIAVMAVTACEDITRSALSLQEQDHNS